MKQCSAGPSLSCSSYHNSCRCRCQWFGCLLKGQKGELAVLISCCLVTYGASFEFPSRHPYRSTSCHPVALIGFINTGYKKKKACALVLPGLHTLKAFFFFSFSSPLPHGWWQDIVGHGTQHGVLSDSGATEGCGPQVADGSGAHRLHHGFRQVSRPGE